ncbi:c-type cytochrome domain-containing protein [Spongiivirga sp. MCCC 1A20706]|uniref:c-type cytochrome domain-containing protein n=1 Tax=Spongiivirga sp. MCCC 1A20706 TaxID=3160963 RepID=UPI003977BDCB
MRNSNQAYRILFFGMPILFSLLTVYATNTEDTPRFILFFGRFHPLLLHLPIGGLIITFIIDILGRIQKNYPEVTIRNLLGLSSFFAIMTCFLGYFLSLEGGYEKNVLDIHLYTGIATAVLASVLFYISISKAFQKNKIFLPFFVTTLVLVGFAGHFGSVLTHGDNFLTEYATAPKKERTIEVIDSLRMYQDVVGKILDKKCVQCHNATKQKGELSLLSKDGILKGGKTGVTVVPNKAGESLLYSRLLLPLANEKHMPPEGKEQLTKDEIWLIKHWIEKGVDFEGYVTETKENEKLSTKLNKYLVFDKVEIRKASVADIKEVRESGYRVVEIVPGEAGLSVKYLGGKASAASMKKLVYIKDQIVELDLSNASLDDTMTAVLANLKNLESLRLNGNAIGNKTLKKLQKLERLKVLNVYHTEVSELGIKDLLASANVDRLYTWKTNLDQAKANALEKEYQVEIQNELPAGFVEASQLEVPLVTPIKTLFKDTIHVSAKSRLKGVKLHYTLDGSLPNEMSEVLDETIVLDHSKTFKIIAIKNGWKSSDILTKEYAKVKYEVSSFSIRNQPDKKYPDASKLFDLEEATTTFSDGKWTGYNGVDLNCIIDLGEIKSVDNISISSLEDVGSWIFFPKELIVYASNNENANFKKVGSVPISRKGEGGVAELKKVTLAMPETEARYFKVVVKNYGKLPSWHPGAGNPSWLFVDEVYLW